MTVLDFSSRIVIVSYPCYRLTTASARIREDTKSVYNCIYTRFCFCG